MKRLGLVLLLSGCALLGPDVSGTLIEARSVATGRVSREFDTSWADVPIKPKGGVCVRLAEEIYHKIRSKYSKEHIKLCVGIMKWNPKYVRKHAWLEVFENNRWLTVDWHIEEKKTMDSVTLEEYIGVGIPSYFDWDRRTKR